MEELDRILKQLEQLGVSNKEIKDMRANFEAVRKAGGDVEAQLKLMDDRVARLNETAAYSKETFRDLTLILSQNVAEQEKGNSVLKSALSIRRGTRDIAKELLYDEEGITSLNEKQLQQQIIKLGKNQESLEQQQEILKLKHSELDLETSQQDLADKILKKKAAELGITVAKLKKNQAAVSEAENEAALLQDTFDIEKGLLEKSKGRLEVQQSINKSMGLTGDAIKSAAGFMGKLGLSSKILGDATEEATKAMEDYAKANQKVDAKTGKILKHADKTGTALAGLGPLAKGFGKALGDPLTIITGIFKGFLAVNKAQVESIRLTGAAASAQVGFSMKVASTSEVIANASAATRKFGIDANHLFGNELLTSMTYFQHELGLTGDQAARLGGISISTGKDIEAINSSISKGASEMNKLAKSGVPVGIVLQDVLNASDDVSASLGNSPKALARAATAARALGMDLNKVNSIADGLLDFESSIENELQAQLLTGKNINLSKARELALANDLEGVARELAKNGASAAEFASMNRVAQNALAKAMGMSRQELGRMVLTQEKANSLTDEQRAKIAGVTVEQLKSEDVQARLNRSLAMLGESMAPMLEVLAQMVSVIIVPISWLAGGIAIVFNKVDQLTKSWGGFANAVAKFATGGAILLIGKSIKQMLSPNVAGGFLKNLKDNFNPKNLGLKNLKEKIGGLFGKGKDKTKELGSKIKEKVSGSTAKTPDISGVTQTKEPKASGEKIKEFFTGLAAGLKEMASMEVVKGALALIPASAGLVVMIPGALGAKLLTYIDGAKLKDALSGMAEGLTEMGTGKVIAGAGALVVASLGFVVMTAGAIGMAAVAAIGVPASVGIKALGESLANIQAGKVIAGAAAMGLAGFALTGGFALALYIVKDVDPKTMLAFTASIAVFGGTLALIGKQASNAIKGAVAMGIMGAALIPAAYAFSLLGDTDPAAIAMLTGSLLVLGTGAAILGSLATNIIMGAAALGILGLAMVPAAYAFSLLKGVDIGSIIAFSIALPLLGLAAAGLGFIAPFIMAGAAAIGVLGLAMIPAAIAFNIMAKADLATIAEGLAGIASVGPKLALAGIGMIALAGGAVVLGLASPSLIFSALALGALGLAAQIAATANLQDIAANLVQLGTAGPGLIAAGVGLFAAAGGITAFALAMAYASVIGGISSLFGGGMMADITQLAAMAEPLATVGTALGAIALGVLGLSTALSSLDISKISALNGLMLTTAIAAPMVAAAGAITGVVESITGTGEESKSDGDSKLVAKIDELILAVKQGGDVFLDGGKVGTSLLLSTYKSA